MQLTIDARLQERVEAVMGEVGQAHRPRAATAVVMDPRNGELLALANWPRVDANDIGAAPASARQNRAVARSYEPGSTFKAFTVAGALEEKLIKPDHQVRPAASDPGGRPHDRGGARARRDHAQHGRDTRPVLERGLGDDRPEARQGALRQVGPPVRLRQPHRHRPPGRGRGDRAQAQAVLRLVAGQPADRPGPRGHPAADGGRLLRRSPTAAFCTGRTCWPASEARAVGSCRATPPARSPGCSREFWRREERPRRRTVSGYELAGKTGTAQKPDPKTGGYSDFKFFSSFIGFAPARNPRLMISVMVDEPTGQYYGGEVAAPAFERIVEFALPYLRIPPR